MAGNAVGVHQATLFSEPIKEKHEDDQVEIASRTEPQNFAQSPTLGVNSAVFSDFRSGPPNLAYDPYEEIGQND